MKWREVEKGRIDMQYGEDSMDPVKASVYVSVLACLIFKAQYCTMHVHSYETIIKTVHLYNQKCREVQCVFTIRFYRRPLLK